MNKQQEPRLRFKGFTGNWEEIVLEEVVNFFSGLTYSPNDVVKNGTLVLRSSNVQDNQITTEDNVFVKKSAVNCQNVEVGDVIVVVRNGSRSLIGKHAIIKEKMPNTVIGAFMTGVRSNQPDFLNALLDSYKFNQEIEKNLGATINQITTGAFRKMEFSLPSLPEQTHLGLFFRRLDSQIAESRAVLEKSRQLKKAMLAKMFPANGEKIPKIRFKGFEGEWKSRKLGIEVEIIGGGTPDTTNSTYWNGDIDWYSPTEIGEAAYATGSVKKITLLGLQKSSAQILPANRTVLFTSRASIGDMAILTKDGATNQGFQSFVVGERLDVYFLYTMGFKIKDYALKNASGSTFLEISKNTLSQMEFFAPSLKEQTAIGNFFRQLDETIALQTAEVEKLNQLKKGLLAAMLV